MTHPRTIIRDAIVTTLSPLACFGGNVRGTRLETTDTDVLPSGTVMTLHETVARETTAKYLRTPKIQITGTIVAPSDADAALDIIAEQVEAAMQASVDSGVLRPLLARLTLIETRFDFRAANANGQALARPIARIGLIYEPQYRTTFAGTAG